MAQQSFQPQFETCEVEYCASWLDGDENVTVTALALDATSNRSKDAYITRAVLGSRTADLFAEFG